MEPEPMTLTTMSDRTYTSYRDILSGRQLLTECHLKTLRDICLNFIGRNLNRVVRASQYLAPLHKELIIERLAFHDLFTPSYLPYVTYNLFSPLLKRVNLYQCPQVNENLLRLLAESKCQLQFLTIHGCEQVTDAALLHITRDQVELRELELRKLSITKKGVQNIRSPCLEKLDLRGCLKMENQGVQTILISNPSIKFLNLVGCSKLTDAVLPIVARTLNKSLLALDIADNHDIVTDQNIPSLAEHCPALQSLNILGYNKVTGASFLKLFEKCPDLSHLDLSYCSRLLKTPSGSAPVFLNFPSGMRELVLNGVLLTDADLLVEGVGRLNCLEILKLSGVPALNDSSMQQLLQKVGGHLEVFDINGSLMSDITDEGIRSIAVYCKKVSTLGLSLLRNVTGVTLLPLLQDHQRAAQLRKLLLCCKKLDVSVLNTILDNCYNLVHLDIAGLDIVTDDILQTLANNCQNLIYLSIKACRNVTDDGVIAVTARCPLCVLVMSGVNSITNKSILAIANNCPYLEEIYLSGCSKVSQSALRYLQDACIPRVSVSHRVPNFVPTARNLDTDSYETYL